MIIYTFTVLGVVSFGESMSTDTLVVIDRIETVTERITWKLTAVVYVCISYTKALVILHYVTLHYMTGLS